jgi:hypothetical protein
MSLEAIKVELLRAEFPMLRPDQDPDIERYFELRAAGRPGDALALYEARLRPRYPDDAFRAGLLRSYRLRDGGYARGLAIAYARLGDRLLERVKRTLKYIALRTQDFDPSDAYSTLKAAEGVLAMLPRERFEAIAALERLRRFAGLLDFYAEPLAVAEELVRAYLNEAIDVVEDERRRRQAEREAAAAERRRRLIAADRAGWESDLAKARAAAAARAQAGAPRRPPSAAAPPRPVFDWSRLRFSAADVARIQIPPGLTSLEDKTLAYCFKYWRLVDDVAFERTLFLYARKNGTKHYEVFRAIQVGRRSGRRDEEILAAVSSILTVGYYYSIRGDVYLQRAWARLKAGFEKPPLAVEPPSLAPPAVSPQTRTPSTVRRDSPLPFASVPAVRPRRRGPQRRQLVIAADPPASVRSAAVVSARPPALAAAPPAAAETKSLRAAPPVATTSTAPPAAAETKSLRAAPPPYGAAPPPYGAAPSPYGAAPPPASLDLPPSAAPAQACSDRTTGGSVADRLCRLSGRSYDVYQERFLAKVRPAIRRVLADHRGGGRQLFVAVSLEAEEIVFQFLKDHYADPYMDWERSAARTRLAASGFELPAIDPVIEDGFRRL